jgi:hypothetical protein
MRVVENVQKSRRSGSVRRTTRTSCRRENPGPVNSTREKPDGKSVIKERKIKDLGSNLEV